MTIKHLCLTGGGPNGLIQYGALKALNKNHFWELKDIETIYSTSFGAIISVFLLLELDWEILDDYLIKRPWNKELKLNSEQLLNYSSEKGFFDKSIIDILFKSLFSYKNIDLDITLIDFFSITNIELNIIACDLNSLKEIRFNHIDYPDLILLDAVYRSATLPFFFKPQIIENQCFIDGGMVNNFPINYLINSNIDKNTILGIVNNNNITETLNAYSVNENDDIFNFFYKFSKIILSSLLEQNNNSNKNYDLPYILTLKTEVWTMEFMNKTVENANERENLINNGIEQGNHFYNTVSRN
jgi:predicted acylesterase/phospholipase RssA